MEEQLDDGDSTPLITQLKSIYPADKYSLYSSDTEERVSFSCMAVASWLATASKQTKFLYVTPPKGNLA